MGRGDAGLLGCDAWCGGVWSTHLNLMPVLLLFLCIVLGCMNSNRRFSYMLWLVFQATNYWLGSSQNARVLLVWCVRCVCNYLISIFGCHFSRAHEYVCMCVEKYATDFSGHPILHLHIHTRIAHVHTNKTHDATV